MILVIIGNVLVLAHAIRWIIEHHIDTFQTKKRIFKDALRYLVSFELPPSKYSFELYNDIIDIKTKTKLEVRKVKPTNISQVTLGNIRIQTDATAEILHNSREISNASKISIKSNLLDAQTGVSVFKPQRKKKNRYDEKALNKSRGHQNHDSSNNAMNIVDADSMEPIDLLTLLKSDPNEARNKYRGLEHVRNNGPKQYE